MCHSHTCGESGSDKEGVTGSSKSALPTLELREQEEDVIAAISKVFSLVTYTPHVIISYLNMVKYEAHNQSLNSYRPLLVDHVP